MQFFREERMRAVRALAGDRYSANSASKKRYINLISLYVNIVSRNLISKNPRVMLSTFERDQKSAVSAAEMWLNQEFVRMNFAGTMSRIVLDALLSIGIAKISLATPEDAAIQGWGLRAGSPFITRVDLDDFVFDHRARDFEEVRFIGHRYRAPLAIVRDNPHFDKKARARLKASDQISYNREGDERIGEIGRDYHGYDEDLEDMIDLWEIYLPAHKCVKTFTEDDLTGPSSAWEGSQPIALRTQDWIGPDTGPYPLLMLQQVPGNIFPKGPVQDLINLDEAANESYRKLMRQAARLKSVSVGRRDNPEDAKSMQEAADGDFKLISDPQAVQEVVMGGPHAGLFQWAREVISRFMEQGGNLMTMGGLAPQASTLGQEELLAQQSNGQVASMQDLTTAFVAKCADNMLWYNWHDPRLVMKTKLNDPRLPDVDYTRMVHPWTASEQMQDPRTGQMQKVMRRTGEKPDLKIDPYSMRHQTPQQRARDLTQFLTQLYVPLAQLFQQQGIVLDLHAYTGMIGKYIDAPDLLSIFTVQAPEQSAGNSPAEDGPRKPPSTERTYTRRSLGGESSQAQNMEMDNAISESAAMAGQEGY